MTLLFRSPWHRDPVVVLWLVLLALVALVRLPAYLSWGAPFRLALLFGYLTTMFGYAAWSFLLFALLPALVRRWWRWSPAGGARTTRPANAMAYDVGWRAAAPVFDHVHGLAPRFTLLSVSENAVVDGVPIRIAWDTVDAWDVTIDGRRLPPRGSFEMCLDSSREVLVQAHGPGGTTASSTGWIRVFRTPRVAQVQLPPAAHVQFRCGIDVGVRTGSSLHERLDAVLAQRHPGRDEGGIDVPRFPRHLVPRLRAKDGDR